MLRLVESAKCFPVTLAEARRHLVVDSSDSNNDATLNLLIHAASNDAEMRTGRVWVSSVWNWTPDSVVVGTSIEFPIIPVTKVEVYDMDEVAATEADRTDISGEVVSVSYPSPEPQGEPIRGSLLPLIGFPSNFKILLTAGYPVTETTTTVEQTDDPILVVNSTKYTSTKIALVFNRPISGSVETTDFTITQDGNPIVPGSVAINAGRVELTFDASTLVEGSTISLSFIGGSLYDEFSNFVQPITAQSLPTVVFGTEAEFVTPTPVPTTTTYTSNAPEAVKSWILTRVGTLYNQRSELALRAGSTNNALFGSNFIDCLLAPYKTRFV